MLFCFNVPLFANVYLWESFCNECCQSGKWPEHSIYIDIQNTYSIWFHLCRLCNWAFYIISSLDNLKVLSNDCGLRPD